MLRSIKGIAGYVLAASDGDIGRCDDFLFDDRDWAVRFMVAKTAKWLPGRQVVISPAFLGEPDWASHRLAVKLTQKQIEQSPSLEEHAPVSQAYETEYWRHFSSPSPDSTLPPYGLGPGGFGAFPWPSETMNPALQGPIPEPTPDTPPEKKAEHLHSVAEVLGYDIAATDRNIGHVDDFIVDDHVWVLRYLVIDTGNWLPGRRVLVAPPWLGTIDWIERQLHIELEAERIWNAPEVNPAEPIDRRDEAELYDYYGRPYYWDA